MRPWLFVFSGLVLLFLTGCIQFYESEQRPGRGVPLSQAMKASASGSKEPLHSSGPTESSSTEATGYVAASGGVNTERSMVEFDQRQYFWQLLADAAYVVPLNGEIEGFFRYTFTPIAFECERHFLSLYLGGGPVDFKSGSLADEGAKNAWMFEIGLAYRYYLNGSHVLFSPYVTAGLGLQDFNWDFRQAVVVDGDSIDSDSLTAFTGYAGLGVAVWRTKPVSLFGEASFGGTVFFNDSTQGFHNDVFHDFGYFSARAGLSFKF